MTSVHSNNNRTQFELLIQRGHVVLSGTASLCPKHKPFELQPGVTSTICCVFSRVPDNYQLQDLYRGGEFSLFDSLK